MSHLRLVTTSTDADVPADPATGCYTVTVTVDAAFPANGRLHKDVWHNIAANNSGAAMLHVLEKYVGNNLGGSIHKMTATEARA